ncbi:MAG: hypothetical protein Q9174_004484 [Haloplaca sp. 1 TL-2023]
MAESTPRRRSSRLNSRGTTPAQNDSSQSKLPSVLEREESPQNKLSNIDEMISPVTASPNKRVSQHYAIPGSFDTPPPPQRLNPGLDEMHPSKVHHNVKQSANTAPTNKHSTHLTAATPSKSRGSLPGHMSSPGFDFSFTRPESDLSEEAQKIMDSVREEAARIKAQLQVDREKDLEIGDQLGGMSTPAGRKIAIPRSGRYSDVHKQQFKKMDSIANHVSTWKTKIQSTVTAPTQSSLKRSNSKAGLDQPSSGLPRTKSFKSMPKTDDAAGSPGKRMKRTHHDDATQTRPVSRDADKSVPATPVKPQPGCLPSAVTTPTTSSLARSASVKASKTSMIPSLSRSASTKTLGTPQTEGSKKYMSRIAKFSPVKSILHRAQPKFSDDPLKVAAGTHLPLPTKPLTLNKDLPDLPQTPSRDAQRSPTEKKHVNFTPSTKPINDMSPMASPSPSKIPRSDSMKVLPSSNVTHRGTHSKIPNTNPQAAPGLPGDFTFSTGKTINFGPPTSGLSTTKATPTIRAVRPSGFPTPLAEAAFENAEMKGIPHGIGNKKRKHGFGDEDENQENVDPAAAGNGGSEEEQSSPAKRVKMSATNVDATPKKGQQSVKTPKSKGKGRGIMTLGRLSALARPKER